MYVVFFRQTTPKIGDLMKKFAPFLKLYSEYVKNFDHAMNIISMWTDKCPRFATVIENIQVCLIGQKSFECFFSFSAHTCSSANFTSLNLL